MLDRFFLQEQKSIQEEVLNTLVLRLCEYEGRLPIIISDLS